jgi:hypothetical protein
MKCLTCKLVYYQKKYFLLYNDNRAVKIGDYLLIPNLSPVAKVIGISDYGLWSLDNFPHPFKPAPNSIIAAKEVQIETKFKTQENLDKPFYIFEDQHGLILNHDNTVVITHNKTDYEALANQYKPQKVTTLLIGEAPPNNGKSYFYKVPPNYKLKNVLVEKDASLPATIFNHYLKSRPNDATEYETFLQQLKQSGIFLIDMFEAPIEVRENIDNRKVILSDSNMLDLKHRIGQYVQDERKIVFLLARNGYTSELKKHFPLARFVSWKEFRIS